MLLRKYESSKIISGTFSLDLSGKLNSEGIVLEDISIRPDKRQNKVLIKGATALKRFSRKLNFAAAFGFCLIDLYCIFNSYVVIRTIERMKGRK
jgi:hypothetical protein